MEVRTATLDDVPAVVDTAARALDGEAMLRWSFGEDRFRDRIRRHFAHYDGGNVAQGWVRVVEDGAGFAVWIPPEDRELHEAVGPAPAGGKEAILGDHAERWASFWTWVGSHEPAEDFVYLSHIAVAPERQGQGLGKELTRDGIARADRQGVPIWLETSKPKNVEYYRTFGFEVMTDEDAPDGGPHIWFMRREPA